MNRQTSPTFAGLVQEFFTDYMVQQRALSPRTVASYRDTFVLLLGFAEKKLRLPVHGITIGDLSARFLADFLDHLEVDRQNSVRSRNVRLAAVRSFLKFAARRDVANLGVIENALAVPMKRFERKMVGYLTRDQMLAVIDVATDTWIGQRDRLLLTLMFNTGARVSENHRSACRRHHSWPNQQHPTSRKRSQAALTTAVEELSTSCARVAPLESRVARTFAVTPHPSGPLDDQSQRGPAAATGRQGGIGHTSSTPDHAGVAARGASFHRHESSAVRGGPLRDRVVAWSREPFDDSHVCRGRSRDEGTRPGEIEALKQPENGEEPIKKRRESPPAAQRIAPLGTT